MEFLARWYNVNSVPLKKVLGDETEKQTTALKEICGVTGGGHGIILGGSSYIGGANDLQNYGNSVYSKAKEKLIREIAKNIFNALSATGLKNPDTMPLDKLVQTLAKLIPPKVRNPKKFAESFNKNAKKQTEVCNALGTSINRAYGSNIIDLDADVGEMCNKIAEVMESLLTGLNTEFMTIAGDVLQTMKNMQTVMDFIDSAYKRQKELAQQSGDSTAASASAATDEIYTAIKSEYERQSAILANLINVSVGPTGKSLIGSLQDSGDFAGMVKDLKAKVGTTGFGDKLARLLAGISTVAHSAELVEKSLKKIGMSVDEYRSVKNNNDLHMKVYKKIMSHSPTSKELDDMMKAAKIIYNCDYHAISDFLKGKKKGGRMYGGGPDDDNMSSGDIYGGDALDDDEDDNSNLPTYFAKKSLSKKIKDKKKYRELLLKDFRKILKGIYRIIVDNASQISKHIGNEIPITDDMHHFVRAFSILEDLDREKLHIALSGYAKDSVSKEQRERYLNNYDLVIKSIEPLTKGPKGELFRNLQQGLLTMVKAIDDFSDKLVKAVTEIHVDTPDEIASELSKSSKLFFGAGAVEDELGSGSWVPFEKVKNEMKYYYDIANIRRNMSRVNDDLKTYSDNYEQILGEEAGYLINKIQKHYNELINMDITKALSAGTNDDVKRIHTDLHNMYTNYTKLVNEKGEDAKSSGKRQAEWTFKNLQDLWTYQMTSKVDLIKVAQAVDLYLKSFTDGITKNPDSVSHIIKLLDQVEIVARWFNDKSGDNLATLFDVFPSALSRLSADNNFGSKSQYDIIDSDGKENNFIKDKHYYEILEENWRSTGIHLSTTSSSTNTDHTGLPGNPFIGRKLTPGITSNKQLKSLLKLSQRVIKSMRALENILSCFANVGSKFGDLDPMAKTFMNPGQMFNLLCQYISASAFTHQFAPNDAEVPNLVYRGCLTRDSVYEGGPVNTIPTNENAELYRRMCKSKEPDNEKFVQRNIRDTFTDAVTLDNDYDNKFGIVSGVYNAVNDKHLKYHTLAMAAIPSASMTNKWKYHNPYDDEIRLDMAGWKDDFYDTDLLFEMILKSIVAKVFTVIDAYRLFNRPSISRRNYYSLHPLRVILGGNENEEQTGGYDGSVKIIPDAIEFYYRLILLAEYYREKFGFTGNKEPNGDDWRLSMVPSIDGTWSDFIEIIFDKAEYVKEGNYTETQAQKMIKAMNDIWKSYKSKNPTYNTINMLNAFVIEMNSVFGFIKQKEIDNYLNDRRQYLNESPDYNIKEDFIDYDILDANNQFGSKPAPSDKFVNTQLKNNKKQQRNMVFLQEKIEKIKNSIDADFMNLTKNDQDLSYSFYESLRNYKLDLKNSKNEKESYNTVLKMIQGANKYNNINSDKLIMLHEAVVAPLSVLYGTYKILSKYNALLHGCSFKNIEKWSNALTSETTIKQNRQELRASYRKYINATYDKTRNNYVKETFVRSLLGFVTGDILPLHAGFITLPDTLKPRQFLTADNVNSAGIFTSLMNAILELSTGYNKLVNCNISSNGNINIDISQLEDICKTMLQLIKTNIKNLRSSFDPNNIHVIDKFEDSNNIGSTRWIEENLIEILLNDRDECGIPRGTSEHLKYTFDKLLINNSTNTSDAYPNDTININSRSNINYGTLSNTIRSMLYYNKSDLGVIECTSSRCCDFKTFPFNIIQPVREVSRTELKQLYEADANSINNLMPVPCMLFEPKDNSDILTNTYNFALTGQSLLFAFNRILHMYLYVNTDSTTLKIYPALIENFATGAASLEVLQKKAFPNALEMQVDGVISSANTDQFGLNDYLGLPENPSSVVFASSAAIIRSMLATVVTLTNAQKKRFMYDNLLELPEYMKDKMKTNLPIFSKMLTHLYERANLLKMFLNNTNLKKVIPSDDRQESNFAGMGRNLARNSSSVDLMDMSNKSSEENFSHYNVMLTKLMELSNSLRKCADSTYKELQDKPTYFMETSKDFLNDYSNRFGGLPLMPPSQLLIPLRCMEGNPFTWGTTTMSHLLMPVNENGSNVFKFNYATRLILSQQVDVGIEHIPGAKEIYNNYISISSKNNIISPQDYADTIKKMIKLSKFLIDGAIYNRLYNICSETCLEFYIPCFNRDTGIKILDANTPRNIYPTGGLLSLLYNSIKTDYNQNGNCEFITNSIFNTLQNRDINKFPAELSNIAWTGLNSYYMIADTLIQTGDPNSAIYKKIINILHKNEKLLTDADVNAIDANIKLHSVNVTEAYDNEVKYIDSSLNINNIKAVLNISKIYKDNPVTFEINDNRRDNMAPFQFSCEMGLTDVLELTENNNLIANKEKLANCLGSHVSSIKNETRKNMQLYNILDMNIVPINVHAFMREVPFINLLNYSHTFDRLIHEFILPDYIKNNINSGLITENNIIISSDSDVNNTRELLVKLLVHPYAKIRKCTEYFGLTASLFNGNDNLKLGRPRYLSDQLWHKVLLTSSAQIAENQEVPVGSNTRRTNVNTLEMGPSAYEAQRQAVMYGYNNMSGALLNNKQPLPVATDGLKIYKNGKWITVTSGSAHDHMHPGDVLYCAELGKLRFDTKLVRNLTWLVNLQRIMRVIMVTHLSQINTPVVRGLKIANPKITEFDGNEKFEEGDYDGTNYDLV
jgi:hypothetical protein